MIGRIPRWFLMVGIVTATFGCDNVSWGGMSLSLEGPPRDSSAISEVEVPEGAQRFEYGPLLFAGVREGDSARVVPVAELVDGVLRPLPPGDAGARMAEQVLEERLAPGQRLTVFHGGTRIGTFTTSASLGTTTEYCSPRAQASGHVELVPSASEAQRFMALAEGTGGPWSFGLYQNFVAERAQRNAIQNIAGVALNEARAQWPTALQNIRQDLQLFLPPGGETPAVVASFLFQDQMEIGPAPDQAYSLLVVGEPAGRQFNTTFTWYRRVADEGKGAPRLFSLMDWDQDGEDELLLEVFGADSKWWAALERENGNWTLAFQDPCGTPEAQAPPTEGSQDGQG